MRLALLINDVEKRMNDTSQTALVRQWINQAQDEIQSFFDWPFLITQDWIQTNAEYTTGTGTINVTNGSASISGTGTSWTSAMTGRKFRVTGDNEWYVFTYVSGTTGTLDRVYEGTTSTTADYTLFQDTYRTRGDVNKLLLMRNLGQSRAIYYVSSYDLDKARPTDRDPSQPWVVAVLGRDTSTETTGTVSGSTGSTTITGSGTSWTSVEGLTQGLKIRIGNYTYTIKSVDSDTQITTYETLQTGPSGSAYTINLNNILVKFSNPPDSATGIPYRFQRTLPPLSNDWDESEIPEKYHRLLIEGACKKAFIYQFDAQKYQLAKAEFNEGLLIMKSDHRQTANLINVLQSDDRVYVHNAFHLPLNVGSL
jgi:hypothetical protein